jgi:tRNA wybutosine-synthesizing protein 1
MEDIKSRLRIQHYGLVGSHSAVKVCTWTKKSLMNIGQCYKAQFYGIRSHLCCQMTPSLGFCQNNCIYCWRTVSHSEKEFDPVDNPDTMYSDCIKAQRKLISGFGGTRRTSMKKLKEAQDPKHFAISLSGEPTMYPKLGEFIRMVKERGNTAFLVTNGMSPEVLENMEMPTQMYLSLTAIDKESFQNIHQPIIDDGWERLNRSLEILKRLRTKTRTALRITAIKGVNMHEPEKWAVLIKKANPLFLEIKAYMYLGASRNFLKLENMPLHHEVKEFAQEIEASSGYKIIDEKADSRVVLLMKEDIKDRIMRFD